MGMCSLFACLFSQLLTYHLQAQQESLQKTLKNVKQKLKQTRTLLAETKHTFESAQEEWQVDKNILEDMIVDIKVVEMNLAEDRLTCESDAQAHKECGRVSAPFCLLRVFVSNVGCST